MRQYKDYRPTGFDAKGRGLDEQQEWYVAPVIRTRDSGPLEQSNFAAALALLGGQSETVEVHRFGHWGPGWFEIILLPPSLKAKGEEIEASLEDYPVLDEMDLSEREYASATSYWECCSYRARFRLLADRREHWLQARHSYDKLSDAMQQYISDRAASNY